MVGGSLVVVEIERVCVEVVVGGLLSCLHFFPQKMACSGSP